MTTYNGEKFLKEQLDSMLRQSRLIDELVVCDDGSKDGTIGILNEFAGAAPFPVKITINENNLGSTKNFEKVISLCSGDIIILCDQDDIWLPDKVKILVGVFLANPNCKMAFTDAIIVDESNNRTGELWASFYFDKKAQKTMKSGKGLRFFAGANVVTGATAAIAKSLFEEAAPFPEEFVHDYWLATIAEIKGELFFNASFTINYRKHQSQQTGIVSTKKFPQKINCIPEFDKNVKLMQIMLKKLDDRSYLTKKQRKVFTDKMEFFHFRGNMPSNIFVRIPKIAINTLNGNYFRYATGFLSIIKDLLLPLFPKRTKTCL